MIEHDLQQPAAPAAAPMGAHVSLARAAEWAARAQLCLAAADVLAALEATRCAAKAVDESMAALQAIARGRR